MPASRYLSRTQARIFYDRFGSRQDWQRFYEGPAIRSLLARGGFGHAHAVFELGCGTGAFAHELLSRHLPLDATYVGVDISATMIGLARGRLASFADRVSLRLTEGELRFDLPAAASDRFVSLYVLDLLPPEDITAVLAEAHRLLCPGGRLCLASLTPGRTMLSRLVSALWARISASHPERVGGCRPVVLTDFVRGPGWRVVHDTVIAAFGIPSQVLVAVRE
jgi:ubiquinone/menaquinone biosynthesis C-methylase UbiE